MLIKLKIYKIMRVGLFGGSFNPPTKAHINISEHLINKNYFDEIWLLPSFLSGYNKKLESGEHRIKMCNHAINEDYKERIKVCDFEIINQCGFSTYENILLLKKHYINIQFHFILGIDNASNIINWDNFEKLIKIIPFFIVNRDEYTYPENTWFLEEPHFHLNESIDDTIMISSTEAKKYLNTDKIYNFLDVDVVEYIKINNLY